MKLYRHQVQALEQTKDLNRVAYYLDMGLGKTFVGAEKMKSLSARMNLIVCQKSKVNDWFEHFIENYPSWTVFDLTKKYAFETFVNSFPPNGEHLIGVINYELAWRRKDLLNLRDFTLMLDESSLIQNEKAKRSKFILKMNPSNVILLSGTPTSGKYENLWTQIHLLGWNISQNTYNKQYVNWKKIEVGDVIRKVPDKNDPYKNAERLRLKMREHGAIFMKTEECFNLPEQIFIPVTIETSREYRRFEKNSIITIQTDEKEIELVGDSILAKRLYKRMLCGQYSKEKLQSFEDLIESTQDRLIVFYNFDEELNRLKKIAESLERPISEVNGHVKDLDAYEHEDDSITFIQYQAGSMGLNLQKANKIIYFTLPLLSEHFEQSKKRIHRIGQTNACFYYLMICENSVEEEMLKTLEMRKDYTDYLF